MGDLGHHELSQLNHPSIFILSAFQKLLSQFYMLFLFVIPVQPFYNGKMLLFKCPTGGEGLLKPEFPVKEDLVGT